MKNAELFERAKKVLPLGVNSPVRFFEPYPFFVKSASGAHLYDIEGTRYLDYAMGYGALLFGHAYAPIINAVKQRLDAGTLYGTPTEEEVVLAEKLSSLYPTLEMSRCVNSGTEATMHAIRLARGYTKRKSVIKFDGCFHGSHDTVLVKAGSGASTFGVPSSAGVLEELSKYTIVAQFNDVQSVERAFKEQEIAAVIVEPVMANYGLIPPNEDFLKSLRELCDQNNALLIFDEVVTGFRLSKGGAQSYYNVQADITTLGKVLGGGFPIAVYGGLREIMSRVSPSGDVYQAGTYSGNPVSVTAALKVLELLSESLYQRLREYTRELTKKIAQIAEEARITLVTNQIESMFQLFFTNKPVRNAHDVRACDTKMFKALHSALLKEGVFLPPSQFETNFVSSAHTKDELEKTTNAFQRALNKLKTQLDKTD
ncbi:glutamate-1-semialdehyde-2,1-aminomutase [Candidatus Marsarchaeota G2 archaeon ECH_B_SAG-G16]|uniref:Glutamate-1-semialdehyde 2,1-aminomutase n=1 Tax=Candidatus Marsarchaeota G2 archaeon ECH_B_SAG-G16 TaxID=1978167 RepID=A0A2R6C368_9ARCH|nr:MAG: glutamate-1-semialdehyde-2,1-aminomutase [Candidatus Marsarchaeota G2 archaeon ECH_B_SAG-G16]